MASNLKNLSDYDKSLIPLGDGLNIGIVISEWNDEITKKLAEGAISTLTDNGVDKDNIFIEYVPGSFELPLGAKFLFNSLLSEDIELDAVICLGCVIQGETRHFEFICQAVSQGIMQLGISLNLPIIFGVLTTENLEQAQARAGGKHGNKGVEAAVTALKMVQLAL